MFLALLLAALLPASLSCGAEEGQGREIPFTRLEKGISNYYASRRPGRRAPLLL